MIQEQPMTGLDFFAFDDIVELRPITRKSEIGRAQISVPASAIPGVIAILRDFRRATKQNKASNHETEVLNGNIHRNNGQQ
jgi:hypothetical protein